MTGEMSQFDADHGEEWRLQRSIARAVKGKVHAFDVYQGPYIAPPEGGRLWVGPDDAGHALRLFYERQGYPMQASEVFGYCQTRRGCRLARKIVAFVTAADRLQQRARA